MQVGFVIAVGFSSFCVSGASGSWQIAVSALLGFNDSKLFCCLPDRIHQFISLVLVLCSAYIPALRICPWIRIFSCTDTTQGKQLLGYFQSP